MDTTAERTETETGSIESSAFQTEIIEAYQKWQEYLDRDGKDLIELTRTTEKDFLSIGEKLQGFYIKAKDISKSSSSATQLMVGEEITGAIDGLQKILDQMSDYKCGTCPQRSRQARRPSSGPGPFRELRQ